MSFLPLLGRNAKKSVPNLGEGDYLEGYVAPSSLRSRPPRDLPLLPGVQELEGGAGKLQPRNYSLNIQSGLEFPFIESNKAESINPSGLIYYDEVCCPMDNGQLSDCLQNLVSYLEVTYRGSLFSLISHTFRMTFYIYRYRMFSLYF